jgi:glycolate oxidase iron-sulfur subunit
MQTHFSLAQLADPDIQDAEKILRACVHCGFCTATCPTYVLLGDELDSPRGRIYLIKEMLEKGRAATAATVKHIDRCLSCLACMTTCPSGVHYQHLVDHGRAHIEATYRRPLQERLLRGLLAWLLARPGLFRLGLVGARAARPFRRLLPAAVRPLLDLVPKGLTTPSWADRPGIFPAQGPRLKRVALLTGCVQPVLAPQINEATIRLLTRHGCEVVVAPGMGCCGALAHHLGKAEEGRARARALTQIWSREIEGQGLDAIVVNASGCGTQVKDFGFLLRQESAWAAKAAKVSALARDVTELMEELGLGATVAGPRPSLAYHSACSMQHGQKITTAPKRLLEAAGFVVKDVPEGHLCCGSAGTYNLLQPALAAELKQRKLANLARLRPDVIATGNIGCITQLSEGAPAPILHTVELLDWATGGPQPAPLRAMALGEVTP